MVRISMAAAAAFISLSAAGAMAQDAPRWDPLVEQALIAKLQTRLPELRPAYDLHDSAPLPQLRKPRTDLEALATMDAAQQRGRKYTGRIIWM